MQLRHSCCMYSIKKTGSIFCLNILNFHSNISQKLLTFIISIKKSYSTTVYIVISYLIWLNSSDDSITYWPNGNHACLVWWRSWVQILGLPNLIQHCKRCATQWRSYRVDCYFVKVEESVPVFITSNFLTKILPIKHQNKWCDIFKIRF